MQNIPPNENMKSCCKASDICFYHSMSVIMETVGILVALTNTRGHRLPHENSLSCLALRCAALKWGRACEGTVEITSQERGRGERG